MKLAAGQFARRDFAVYNGRFDSERLFQADLDEGEGCFIAPTWMRRRLALAIADVTQDWQEALTGIYEAGAEAFTAWLTRPTHPANVVDFLADKRRGKPRDDPSRSA